MGYTQMVGYGLLFFIGNRYMESQGNSEIILTLVIGSLALLLLAAAIIILTAVHSKRLYKKQSEINSLELHHQQELLEHYINGTEEERKRLAADLHDDIGTRLAALRIKLNAHQSDEYLKSDLDEIIQNVRDISHDIMPSSIALFGLGLSVTQLAESFNRSGNMQFDTDVQHKTNINEDITLALYRVLQELMNNTIRHSQGSKAMIATYSTATELILQYSDNGIGIRESNSDGIGLRSIENRLRMIGANAKWTSESGRGMIVLIKIPILET